MEEDIRQAVALLMKHGFSPQSMSTYVRAQDTVKITMELAIICGQHKDTIEKKLIFERAWLQKKTNG